MGYDHKLYSNSIWTFCPGCSLSRPVEVPCNNVVCSENPANYAPYKLPPIVYINTNVANGVPILCFCGICKECTEAIAKEEKDAKIQEQATQWDKCECGAEAVGGAFTRHSAWCPKYRKLD